MKYKKSTSSYFFIRDYFPGYFRPFCRWSRRPPSLRSRGGPERPRVRPRRSASLAHQEGLCCSSWPEGWNRGLRWEVGPLRSSAGSWWPQGRMLDTHPACGQGHPCLGSTTRLNHVPLGGILLVLLHPKGISQLNEQVTICFPNNNYHQQVSICFINNNYY